MPRPDSRRQDKRAQNLVTMCLLEAVSRTYMFGQSAEFCVPRADDGTIKPFEIGDLWHVIRTAHPTMEMILAAWSQSLEYSVPTSCNGINVMTSICEKFGFDLESLMRAPIADDAADSECDTAYGDLQELPHLMARGGEGSSKGLLRAMELKLGGSRKQRSIFRNSVGDNKKSKSMLTAVEESCDNADKLVSSALFPPFEHVASLFYSPHSLLQWAVDEPSHSPPISSHGEYQHRSLLKFRHLESGEGPTQLDTAWLCVVERKQHEQIPWISAARELMGLPCAAKLADIPTESVGDIMFLLSTSQNNRICPRMPELPSSMRPENAFVDENGQPATASSMSIAVRPVMEGGRTIPAAGGNPGVRVGEEGATGSRDLAQRRIDALVCRGRLPAVSALVSTTMTRMPPLARFTEPKQSLSANSTVLYEHICMVLECILCCNRVPGLKNRQERLSHDQSAPPGLGNNAGAQGAGAEARILPYSIDVVQMGWTVCAFEKLYNPLLASQIDTANSALSTQLGAESDLLTSEDTFECTFRYLGFPNPDCPLAGLKFVSLPWRTTAAGEHVDISDTNPLASITREQLRSQVATALGHSPTDDDIDEYQKGMLGGSFTYGVSGDVNSVATWIEHTGESFIARGNTDGRVDPSGKLGDRALSVGVLGAASGIYARVQERLQQGEMLPTGSSYTYEERHRDLTHLRRRDAPVAQKPRRRISCLPGLTQRNDWACVEQPPTSGERFDTRQTLP